MVFYSPILRNVLVSFVFALSLVACNAGSSERVVIPDPLEEGFKYIFNGEDLSGWHGEPGYWSVEDGAITGRTSAEHPGDHNTFISWQDGELDDFELRLQFRISNGNSGIQYRSQPSENWGMIGYQADIETGGGWMGACYDEHGRGPLAKRGQRTVISSEGELKTEQFADPDDLVKDVHQNDWNDYTIIAQGPHLVQKINGQVMAEVFDHDKTDSDRSGVLALQIHSGPPLTVQFKNIRLKRLIPEDKKKIVMIAGKQSHGHLQHEHNAGVMLLKKMLDSLPQTINTVYLDGWPNDPTAFDNAHAIVIFSDGGAGHPMIQDDNLEQLRLQIERGASLGILHYALGLPPKQGGAEMLKWIGGFWEEGYSANPKWTAEVSLNESHPITKGVSPFALRDEWYFNMQFGDQQANIIPLLKATPPDDVRNSEPSKKYPGREEILSWAFERPDGGRGFAFTGGHYHMNWGNDDYRTFVLNALYWLAGVEIPEEGVPSTITDDDLDENLDNYRRQNLE